ncbi:DNA repair protein RadC [Glaciecola siphonariae]|uniref:DNA repair protein RadC n=1 Tax=Glaciecola siphonariae TaxID=521012 RepID=A0ABV9LWP7_9ALTE
MKILDWPEQERPREKLLNYGAHTLSDAELLAIFLQTGLKGRNAVQLAKQALLNHGSLRALLHAPKRKLLATSGFGAAKYAILQASIELQKRNMTEQMVRERSFLHADDASSYLISQLRDKQREVFSMLMLDSQHQLIAYREMFQGTINSAAVYPRELVKQAMEDNAAAVILAHNHPSGRAEPSQSDINITEKIKQALALVDVTVLDHFVIGDSTAVSFAQRGLL